jgi:hypothetical protein
MSYPSSRTWRAAHQRRVWRAVPERPRLYTRGRACDALILVAIDSSADPTKVPHSFAPAVLRVRVSIEPSAANRSLEVIADGDHFYRSSEIQLEGDHSPVTFNLKVLGFGIGG